MQSNHPQLIDTKEFAAILKLGRTRIFEMKASGQLPRCLKIGRSVRWRLSDVNEWIQAGCPSLERFEQIRKAGVR
jgi:predicted DNA-binding transcriptional regulator AlpA